MLDLSVGIGAVECNRTACHVASDIPTACWRSDVFLVQNVPKKCEFPKIAIFGLWSGFVEVGKQPACCDIRCQWIISDV